MVGDWSFFQEESFCASQIPHSHCFLDNYWTIRFHLCLILRRAGKFSYTARTLQPMKLIIPSKDTLVLHQLHLLPSDHVPPLVFYYKPKHTFVLDKTLFTHVLAIAPHLFLNGLFEMIYEHLLGCFIP
jgi:hypothetical protein